MDVVVTGSNTGQNVACLVIRTHEPSILKTDDGPDWPTLGEILDVLAMETDCRPGLRDRKVSHVQIVTG